MAVSSGAFEVAHLTAVNIAPNTDFFSAGITEIKSVASQGPRKYTIMISLEQTAIASIKYIRDGITVMMSLNSGIPLNGGSIYIFDMFLEDNITINLQHSGLLMKVTCSIITSGNITF